MKKVIWGISGGLLLVAIGMGLGAKFTRPTEQISRNINEESAIVHVQSDNLNGPDQGRNQDLVQHQNQTSTGKNKGQVTIVVSGFFGNN